MVRQLQRGSHASVLQVKKVKKKKHDISGVSSVGLTSDVPLNSHEFNKFMHDSMLKVPPSWAVPQLGCCGSSGRAWRLWLSRHSEGEAGPLGAPPVPQALELAASKVTDSTASDVTGTA